MPTAWNRTFSVLGVGILFLLLTNPSYRLERPFASLGDYGVSTGELQFVKSFILLFCGYIVGEILIFLGQTYRTKKEHALRIHAISLFVRNTKQTHWADRLDVASVRHELFSGLMAAALIFGVIKLFDFLLAPDVETALVGVFSFGFALFFSLLITACFGELERAMDAILELKSTMAQTAISCLEGEQSNTASQHAKTITCPNCAASGDVIFIKHAPLNRNTDAETYDTARSSDQFEVTTIAKKPKWQGIIICKACGTTVRDDTQGVT